MRQIERLRRHGWCAFTPRLQHLVLLLGILPSLTFLGHWGLQFDLPGTNLYVVLVPAANHDEPAHIDTKQAHRQHQDHCHANAASCTDVPLIGASPFALMQDSVAYLGASGVMIAVALAIWRPRPAIIIGPELQPPRSLLAI